MFPDLLRDDVFRLETPRLWLRWPRAADAAAIVRLGGDPQVAEMTASVPHPYRMEDAAKWIFASRAGNAQGSSLSLVLAPKRRPAEAIGAIGLHRWREGAALLGFWLGRPHQGQGLMTEAAEALVGLAFAVGEVDEIHAQARVENTASRRVLEKSGFAYQGRGPIQLPARGGIFMCDRFRRERTERIADTAPEMARPALVAG
ncbi:MAG TPA: GNAT family N-acetyltransferase [Beijerinckiaceae bacterium]|jgi:RimJ/RimL family protein N-acetyltransferase